MQPWQGQGGEGGCEEWRRERGLLHCRRHGQDAQGPAHGAGQDAAQEQARRQEDRQKERAAPSSWGT